MKTLFSAGLVVYRMYNGQPHYLLLHYPHGHWDFAKGKIEPGENSHEAALRELAEEAGIQAEIIPGFEHVFEYMFKEDGELVAKHVTFFVARTDQAEIFLSHEHIGFAWLVYPEALERLTYANARELLQQANQFLSPKGG